MPAVASSAPAVLIGHLADATTTLRVGAGGVMLPNHSPLVIAEQFATLEALHPGRIDLGLGRAPGTDPTTARALRRTADLGADTFPEDVVELINYLVDSDGPPTTPGPGPRPGLPPRDVAARLVDLQRPVGRHAGPAVLASPTTSPRGWWTRPSPSTGRRSGPSVLLDRPLRHGGGVGAVRPDRRRGAVVGRTVGPDHPPAPHRAPRARGHPRGGRGLPVHARGAGRWSTRPPPAIWSAIRTPSTRAGGPAAAHRGRRAHAVHPGPLLRGPGPVAHPGGRRLGHGRATPTRSRARPA